MTDVWHEISPELASLCVAYLLAIAAAVEWRAAERQSAVLHSLWTKTSRISRFPVRLSRAERSRQSPRMIKASQVCNIIRTGVKLDGNVAPFLTNCAVKLEQENVSVNQ